MKIDTIQNPLQTNSQFQATEFKIDDSPYAFQLLVKQLYKNPIQSVIREIVSNAWDSHIQTGTNQPVEVTFPTQLDPYFTVEDFGTGLSPDDMTHVYTVVFRSTRRETNDYFGCFGLGAKSPYSYSDQFIVISYFGGIEYQYAAITNEAGKPSLNLIHSQPTDRHNGVIIKIPVKDKDIPSFTYAGLRVLPWFPNIKTNISLQIPELLVNTPQFAITKKTDLHNGECYALINGVMYDVNMRNLFNKVDYNLRPSTAGWVGNLILKFNIGELTIVPNREDLSYDEKTIEALEQAFIQAKPIAQIIANNRIKLCYTYEEACKKHINLYNILQNFGWWDLQSMYHPLRPKEPLSRFAEINHPDFQLAGLDKGRRNKYVQLDYWRKVSKLDITKQYTVHWFPEDAKHIREKVKQIHLNTWNNENLVALGGNQKQIEHLLNTYLLNPIKFIDQSHITFTAQAKDYAWSGEVDTPLGQKFWVPGARADDFYIKVNQGCSKTHNWNASKIRYLAMAVNFATHCRVALLPKHRWSLAKSYEWSDFEEVAEDWVAKIIQDNMRNMQLHLVIKSRAHAIRNILYRAKQPNHPLHTKLGHLYNDRDYDTLITAAWGLDIEIPKNPQLENEINDLYNRYEPLIINDVTHPILFTAYEYYLENFAHA